MSLKHKPNQCLHISSPSSSIPQNDEYNALDLLLFILPTNVSAYKYEMQGLNVTAYIFAAKRDTKKVLTCIIVHKRDFLAITSLIFKR